MDDSRPVGQGPGPAWDDASVNISWGDIAPEKVSALNTLLQTANDSRVGKDSKGHLYVVVNATIDTTIKLSDGANESKRLSFSLTSNKNEATSMEDLAYAIGQVSKDVHEKIGKKKMSPEGISMGEHLFKLTNTLDKMTTTFKEKMQKVWEFSFCGRKTKWVIWESKTEVIENNKKIIQVMKITAQLYLVDLLSSTFGLHVPLSKIPRSKKAFQMEKDLIQEKRQFMLSQFAHVKNGDLKKIFGEPIAEVKKIIATLKVSYAEWDLNLDGDLVKKEELKNKIIKQHKKIFELALKK